MFDLHSHLLPGIDDGAQSVEDAVELARCAADDGITHQVLTPHIHPGRYENTPETITRALESYREALAKAGLKLKAKAAAEVRLSAEITMMVPNRQVPFLGKWDDYKVLLLELPHGSIPPGTLNLVRWLKQRKILPMIAHPERNKAIMADFSKLDAFIEEGCLFQITAMSITGEFGEPAERVAHEMLNRNWATLIASDAHNLQHRPPVLSKGLAVASELIGEAYAKRLVLDNPAKILGIDLAA